MNKKVSAKQKIFNFLLTGQRINKYDAFRLFGTMVCTQRVHDIYRDIQEGRIKGYRLNRKPDRNHKGAMVYWLEPEGNQLSLPL